jgi:hypothetical protein
MAGGLDNLTADGLSGLASRLNEATRNLEKALQQQEAILKTTLELEEKIVSTRVAGLKESNDGYSKLLNNMEAQLAYLSAEMFKIGEAGSEAAANAERAAKSAEKASSKKAKNETISDEQSKALGSYESGRTETITERLKKQKTLDDQIQSTLKREKDAVISIEQLRDARHAAREKQADALAEKERNLENTMLALTMARLQEETDRKQRLHDVELTHMQEMADAELNAQNLQNKFQAELAYASSPEAADIQKRQIDAEANTRALNELQTQLDAEREAFIHQQRLKNNGEINANELAEFNKRQAKKYSSEEKLNELKKKQLKEEEKAYKERSKGNKQKIAGAVSFSGFSADDSLKDRIGSLSEMRDSLADHGTNANGDEISKGTASLIVAVQALSSLAQQLESKMDEIASYKGAVDTRLHGSSNETWAGSYWDQIVHDMTAVGAVNPFFKQEDFAKKIEELVNSGIAFDLEQRAFLATISDKIATTFNVADATLLRLVRIQQQDSTAGRLGMEAALNAFLNEMYENTEYLENVAQSVRTSLEEMQALMEGAAATEVEYQVQKWMGSLFSVGMSQNAVNSISTALGQIAAGQIEGLTGEGAGNLLIMAANDANIPIADILTKGLDASETNKLMQAVVNYLAEIAEASQDNQVVQQQLANVFGVKASDLKAATNLATKGSVGAIYNNSMSYDNMLNSLFDMAGSMWQRTSLAEMMTNVWNNVQYSLAGSMASNPMSYILYKTATLLDNTVGGIAVPAISAMGSGVDLETTVADLMRVGAISTGVLGSIGALVQGLGNSFSGRAMLEQLGISSGSGLSVTPRGVGASASNGAGSIAGTGTSSSGYVGNASGSDVRDSTLQEAEDSKEQLMVEAQEEAESNQIDILNETVLKIYELLDDVAHGSGCLNVKVEGYGLTKAGGTGNLGGVSALGNSSNSNGLSNTSLSGSGTSSNGISGSVNFGGWTTSI